MSWLSFQQLQGTVDALHAALGLAERTVPGALTGSAPEWGLYYAGLAIAWRGRRHPPMTAAGLVLAALSFAL